MTDACAESDVFCQPFAISHACRCRTTSEFDAYVHLKLARPIGLRSHRAEVRGGHAYRGTPELNVIQQVQGIQSEIEVQPLVEPEPAIELQVPLPDGVHSQGVDVENKRIGPLRGLPPRVKTPPYPFDLLSAPPLFWVCHGRGAVVISSWAGFPVALRRLGRKGPFEVPPKPAREAQFRPVGDSGQDLVTVTRHSGGWSAIGNENTLHHEFFHFSLAFIPVW